MSVNVPLVRRAIAGAALAHGASSPPNPLELETPTPIQESQWTPAALERAGSTLKALNRMAKRPPVHILFEDVGYTVSSHKGERRILHHVSGEFRSGELTCILGPSGAGKSTLLNILAGYTSNGVSGRITVNGHAREMRVFKKLSSYIMQDDMLQPRLSALELMRIAADLKLGKELGRAEKELIIEEILQTLGLWEHRDTRSERLSGGQYKRLSVALELVNNPPIIFLDEPTTGLDIVSVRQLVVLLRLLSRQGRTIICTVHQPSASLFSLFDRIYVLARGLCCYQGAPPLLVPYLSEVGHVCPTTHNPADFVVEALVEDIEAPAQMSELCQNGKLCRKLDRITARGGRKPVLHSDESIQRIFVEHVAKEQTQKMEFATTFLTQFLILSKRMFVQNTRNSLTLWIQLLHHLISAGLLGSIFFLVGNDASAPIVNFKFCLSCLVFFMYTYIMIPVLLFPTEVRLLRREYFNRWYSLKAYYAALTFSSLPVMASLGFLFLGICYFMSGQLMEWDRFILFSISGLLTAICSEGLGLLVGSAFSVTNGSIVGPAIAAPLLALCCYGMGFGPTIETSMRTLMSASYLRYGLSGFSLSLYQNRQAMECHEDFCLYADPNLILRDVGMANDNYIIQVVALLAFTALHRLLAYFALRYRLTAEFSNKFMAYVSKFLKHR
ncbi:ATP-binding cassette subfamily G member 4-like [Ostrinia nubilalis]|uniref:ATP-binding cassette subfamily G member 4-like n=1 Tax=Ostrinia nubilalis TaxID=29057 RepID=UPI00103D6606|nr:ATP-binding cassette sub-family G member 4-like isoform X1 [Ostrinia furnacalis]XP_028164907.1 ATP-binding cassette sub-family G member 4-like isoform X3 [Ostrinia furnacalis]